MVRNSLDSVEVLETRRFRVCGIVQGVGFRPFVHRLARNHKANGWVLNDSEGVLLELQASVKAIENFIDELVSSPPPLAKIIDVREVFLDETAPRYQSFDIRKSRDLASMDTIIPPDSNVCEDCLQEMRNPDNRRYRYAFINCTNCGPRYSIILGMPYDRSQSTMRAFTMCPQCHQEYLDIEDRRYHAQPNACQTCGPRLQFTDRCGIPIETDDVVRCAIARLREGAIVAIKSLGGFHLAVDASNEGAVRELRRRKQRDAKPFAVMVADAENATRWAFTNKHDELLLNSVQRPIVLLRKRSETLPEEVAPRNPNLGVMLPSTPLQHLLLEDPALPVLVMTSGNLSGHPIVFENHTAIEQLGEIADYFILNDRDIRTRVDDSVVRGIVREGKDEPQIFFMRRSRGYAPYPIHLPYSVGSVVALGAELKTTVSISKGKQVFISQHIGDLKNDTTFKSHIDCARHMQELLAVQADTLACDLHPAFRSTRNAIEQSEIRVVQVQHHHAHMVSCMAENGLSGKTIGVVFDGTGYGTDGTIWGGEFLLGDFEGFERVGHLRPMLLLGGDKAVKEPIRIAMSLLVDTFGERLTEVDVPALSDLPEQRREVFTKMAIQKINAPSTSSMGRLFDGISALMGICAKVEYEAQAAIEMEALLQRDFSMAKPFEYDIKERDGCLEVDYRPLVGELVRLLREPVGDVAELSRRFHSTIVDMIGEVCCRLVERFGVEQIVLSGGVFCNEFILINALNCLEDRGFKPHCHQLVPTNDGGISLGQVVVAAARIKREALLCDGE
ncbi:carbamoyltransferase HypF [Serratia sp. UGAL515B_01]|uniref:carbamoyltransferase HypF n=1 Tax=Serratia sp. UGAL515B_01 TaxID=2986763 RepID=UPI002952D61D|nr:carbamoyltransferase HypF [Serratia sp. UGAL515B_01]WON77440.1 carbamoyltransferase HypF [Serratia sp. UGAL515B_01]